MIHSSTHTLVDIRSNLHGNRTVACSTNLQIVISLNMKESLSPVGLPAMRRGGRLEEELE